MNNDLISQIFEVCLIPLLGILTTYFVKWLNAKNKEIQLKTDNDLLNRYLDMLTQTVTDCVIATNQTYVNSLKAQGNFDMEAQKVAFELTSKAVITILADDAKEYLDTATGDLNELIKQKIEASVNQYRDEK